MILMMMKFWIHSNVSKFDKWLLKSMENSCNLFEKMTNLLKENIIFYVLFFWIKCTMKMDGKCSCRLTMDVFVCGLSSRPRAPSFCTVCEYLKRSGQKSALTAVCTPIIKSAGEKHQRDTPPYRSTMTGCSEGGLRTE